MVRTATRVAVFIDYMNCYRRAREALRPVSANHVDGQIHPRRLGVLLRGLDGGQRELVAVRVYRGMPSSFHDPKGYGAADRQVALWSQQGLVTAITRPLNYRDPEAPKEKGIDVRLAIDMVVMAMMKAYDVAVVVSEDTDLLPAIEAVTAMKSPGGVEVVTWMPANGMHATPLRLKGHNLAIHRLTEKEYGLIHDDTDYTVRRRRR